MMVVAEKASEIGLHMVVSFGVMVVCTGSMTYGGVAALLEPVCMVALAPLHERLWHAIRRRHPGDAASGGETAPAWAGLSTPGQP